MSVHEQGGGPRRRLAAAIVAALATLGVLAPTFAGSAAGLQKRSMQGPPSNSVRPTISGTPRQGETLTASSGSWVGATPMVFSYQWRLCNLNGGSSSAISGANDQTIVLSTADIGHTLRVLVSASNSDGQASALSQPTQAIVAKGAPLSTVEPKISGTTRQAETLSAEPGTWTGDQPFTYAYQWQRCNQFGEKCGDIRGATSRTYTLVAADVGHTLRVRVTASNDAGKSIASSRPSSIVVAGQAPANTAPPALTGQTIEGQTPTTSDGSWSGSGRIQFSYQWQRCDASGTNCSFISGAASKTYALTSADVGHQLRSAVTARNGVGRATAYSNSTQVVSPRNPTNTALPTISGTAQVGSKLTASNGSWKGPGPDGYFHQWARSNSKGGFDPIPGASGQTYTPTTADAGHLIFVQVKAQNPFGAGFADSKGIGPVAAAGQVTMRASQRRLVYGQWVRPSARPAAVRPRGSRSSPGRRASRSTSSPRRGSSAASGRRASVRRRTRSTVPARTAAPASARACSCDRASGWARSRAAPSRSASTRSTGWRAGVPSSRCIADATGGRSG
jgi:hypothetical protein